MEDETETPRRRERLWTPAFVLIVGVSLCTFMTGQGLNSGTSVYVTYYGGTATYAGTLAAVFSASSALARLVTGPLVDRRGRRNVMLVGGAMLLVGTIGPLFTHATAAFVVFRTLQGIGFSALTTGAATAAADVLPASRLGEGIGYFGLGQALAMSVGPALALFLVSSDPPENLYLGTTVLAICGVACAFLCRYERHPEQLPATSAWRVEHMEAEAPTAAPTLTPAPAATQAAAAPVDEAAADAANTSADEPHGLWVIFEKRALPGMVPLLLLSPAFGFGIFFIGLYGTTLGLTNTGLFFTASAITMIILRLTLSKMFDRVAPIGPYAIGCCFGIASFAMLFAAGTVLAGTPASEPVLIAAGVPYGVCMGINMPLAQAVSVRNSPPERYGAATALNQMAPDLGGIVSSIVWGITNDLFGFPVTICCVIACIVASALVAWAMFPKGAPNAH